MALAGKICIFAILLQGVCCRDFNISLPEKIQALSGSCVIIKCRFEINETYDKDLTESNATGFWLKNSHEVFNSRDPKPNNFEGKMSGKLHEKNCTTIFYNVSSQHNGTYLFSIESGKLKYKYIFKTSSINVAESPVNPQVVLYEDEQELQDLQEVLEGRSVSLRCSAKTLCSSPPATLTWSSTARIPHSESSKQQDLIVSDLNFTAAPRHNRVTFTCSISYQLQDNNRTAHSSITLHVQYAPQIFSYSSCTSTNVTVCFCEVDGNPLPEVEWHLSGHLVLNSSNTFISEERLSNTSLRSFISLQQFLSHTNTLLCLSKNSHGSASQQLHMNFVSTEASWFSTYSFLIGVVVGAVLVILCVSAFLYKRIYKTKMGTKSAFIQTEEAVSQDNDGEPIYVNEVMMSSARAAQLGSSYKPS